jgi:hypothetical protein
MTIMFSTLLLTAALAVAQADGGKLEIANPRATYGYLGTARPKGAGILPGDIAYFSFDIKNLKHDAGGKASFSVAIEVRNSKGELAYQQEPHNAVAQNFLGGNSHPASAQLDIPLHAEPGEHSWKVTVYDRLADTSAVIAGKGTVLKPDFGIIRVGTFADAQGRTPVPPVGVVGGTCYVSFAAVGFGRSKESQQPDLTVKMRILDESGKATIAQPLSGHVKSDIAADAQIIPLQFAVAMNRAGNYTVELTARCAMSAKTSTVTFPLRVLANE